MYFYYSDSFIWYKRITLFTTERERVRVGIGILSKVEIRNETAFEQKENIYLQK